MTSSSSDSPLRSRWVRERATPGLLALLVTFAALPSFARAAETTPSEGTSLIRLVRQLAEDIVSRGAEAPIGVHVRGVPELSRAASTLLLAELSARKLGGVSIEAQDAEAAARAAGARSLVRLTVSLEQGQLAARGDLLGTWVNFWSGKSRTRPVEPAAALERSVEPDAHVLALAAAALSKQEAPATAGPLRLVGAIFARLPARPAAIAGGDLDGDGRAEVVALTDDEVLAFSPEGRLLARYEHRGLPSAQTPCREPFGAIAVQGKPARIAYFSAQRARGELLSLEKGALHAQGPLEEVVLWAGAEGVVTGRPGAGLNTFEPEVSLAGRPLSTRLPFSALSGHRRGGPLWATGPGGAAVLLKVTGETGRLAGVGAGSTLADLNGDGQLEVVVSSPKYQPEPDELKVVALSAVVSMAPRAGARPDLTELSPLWRGPVPRGRALSAAAVDLDGDGSDEVVLGIWLPDGAGELQVFRRAP